MVDNEGTSIMTGCSMIQTTCSMTLQIVSNLLKRGGRIKEIDTSVIHAVAIVLNLTSATLIVSAWYHRKNCIHQYRCCVVLIYY